MHRIFGVENNNSHMRALVAKFQNRIMFSYPDRCQLLKFMVIGAAIIIGTRFPGAERIQALGLLGDVHVNYHACERASNIQVITEVNVIQLALGVVNIMCFDEGRLDISVEVVAKT